jgi:hypothetical protein
MKQYGFGLFFHSWEGYNVAVYARGERRVPKPSHGITVKGWIAKCSHASSHLSWIEECGACFPDIEETDSPSG